MKRTWGGRFTSFLWLGCTLLPGCSKDEASGTRAIEVPMVTVLRVESLAPEKPGAEHCDAKGQKCSPLAPQQKLKPEGMVRTFAGGRVSLDFGGGRRVDLDSMSETILAPQRVKFEKGQFSLDSTPLVQKEQWKPLTFVAGGKEISSQPGIPTTAAVSVHGDDTLLTVRKGGFVGVEFPALGQGATQAGQSLRLANAQAYRTGRGGQELPALPLVAPRADEFGGLLEGHGSSESRGLGTMTARLPNTTQVRDGVHLKKHHVRVVIRDGFARTEVEEEFYNSSPHVLEGRYRFPVPGDASLSRLALWVGDELIEGEVLERERAADIYSRIVDRPVPRDPALLEWVTGGEMSLKVFPIVPKKSRRVILAYNQALSTEGGLLRYVYPLSLGQGRETKVDDLSIAVHLSDSRAELRNLRTPHHEATVGHEGSWKTVTLSMKDAVPTRDFVVLADREITPAAQLSAYVPAWGKPKDALFDSSTGAPAGGTLGHFALRLSVDLPEGTTRPASLPQDRAIVLDISQSQSRETIAAQGALAYGIIRDMDPGERFVLVACDSACHTFAGSQPGPDRGADLDKARDFLLGLRPGGSSDIAGALVAGAAQVRSLSAGAGRERQVIFIGDGQASSGELSAEGISRRAGASLKEAGADLRLVGAGRTVDEDTLRGLATALDATFDLLRSGTSLEARVGELSMSLRRPVLNNARLALPGSLRSEDAATLSALRLGQEIIVTGQILDLAGGEVILEGTLDGAPYRSVKAIEWDKSSEAQNPLVPRLWARAELERLQAKEETPAVKAEIIRVSQAHRTMSRHTSFLVLESEKMYADFKVERTTRSKEDQLDSGFSDLDDAPPPPARLDEELDAATSFEDLESAPAEKDNQAPARPSAVAPRPAPAPAPKPKKSSAGMDLTGPLGGMASGSSANRGSLSTGGSSKGEGQRAEPRPDWDFPGDPISPPRPIWRPRPEPRRARLVFTQANDEWRKWGEANIETLVKKLAEDPESRARHEAYIRGHLQHGRFGEARRDAEALVKMDPDYAPARELLAYAAVVDGDHELARKMLDVQTEAAPRDVLAHAQSARGFEAVGDLVRACAHYRSLAELAPQLSEATERAESCWAEALGKKDARPTDKDEGDAGQLQVDVQCDEGVRPQDCPSPIVVSPDGTVLSPWTPGTGRSTRTRVTFVKLRTGSYYVLVLGGAPSAKGKVVLTGRRENQAFRFDSGSMHTVAKTQVSFW